jgi:hypothetical protein
VFFYVCRIFNRTYPSEITGWVFKYKLVNVYSLAISVLASGFCFRSLRRRRHRTLRGGAKWEQGAGRSVAGGGCERQPRCEYANVREKCVGIPSFTPFLSAPPPPLPVFLTRACGLYRQTDRRNSADHCGAERALGDGQSAARGGSEPKPMYSPKLGINLVAFNFNI